MPGLSILLRSDAPNYTIEEVTNAYLDYLEQQREYLVGRSVLKVFPANPKIKPINSTNLESSLMYVVANRKPHSFSHRYDIKNNQGKFLKRYWAITNVPILDQTGDVQAILHTVEDRTTQVLSEEKDKQIKGLQSAYDLFMQVPDCVCMLRGDDLIVDLANEPVLHIWGKKHDIVGKPVAEAIPEIAKQGFTEMARRVKQSGVPLQLFEAPIKINRDGKEETTYYDFIYHPYASLGSGRPDSVLIMGHDVTEKVRAFKNIHENENRYRTLIEESTVATALYHGPELNIQYVNQIMLDYWGLDESVRRKTLAQVLPDKRFRSMLRRLQKVYQSGQPFIGTERPVKSIDGDEIRYFNLTFKPLRDAHGHIYGIHHMAIDVTEAVQSRKAVEEREMQYRELSHSLERIVKERTKAITEINETFNYAEQVGNFGSYRLDFQTNMLHYSDNLFALLGCSPNEFVPTPEKFLDFVHQEDQALVQSALQLLISEKVSGKWEYRVIQKGGQEIDVRGYGNIITDAKNNTYLIGTVQDITEEKKTRRELYQKNEELSQMNSELESFAYISSHDLQEPLRKIQTFASRVIEDENHSLSVQAMMYFERMQSAAHRMQMLIDDLLAYSRTSVHERHFERVHLGEMISEVIEEVSEDLMVYNGMVETGLMHYINVIPFQFRQVLHNLIGNALKFSRHEKSPHIYITSKMIIGKKTKYRNLNPDELYCHISVCDNGIGFSPEFADKIFEVFQRLHNRDKYNGTGIGLAIVKKIIDNHRGLIKATGEPNKGSTFDIFIPAEQKPT
jgi:PAS domain S-box-containing protein